MLPSNCAHTSEEEEESEPQALEKKSKTLWAIEIINIVVYAYLQLRMHNILEPTNEMEENDFLILKKF